MIGDLPWTLITMLFPVLVADAHQSNLVVTERYGVRQDGWLTTSFDFTFFHDFS